MKRLLLAPVGLVFIVIMIIQTILAMIITAIAVVGVSLLSAASFIWDFTTTLFKEPTRLKYVLKRNRRDFAELLYAASNVTMF